MALAKALYHEKAKGISWEVLAKLCTAINCQPGDLLEHVSGEKEDSHGTEI
ncbi:MAG: helix-turn-helix domain-containing protein [Desulfitobacteriaceae bacterium]